MLQLKTLTLVLLIIRMSQVMSYVLDFPTGYKLIGSHFIPEKRKNIFFLVNPSTGDSEIGFMDNNNCQYQSLVNAPCLKL